MSNIVAEAAVRIRPDLSGFREEAAAQIQAGIPQLQARADAAFAEAGAALERATKTTAASVLGTKTTEEAAVAAEQYALAAQKAARADLELVAATGKATSSYTASIKLLTEQTAATNQATIATERLAQSERKAQTFRSQFRNVAEGSAGIGSLIGPKAIAGFALAGLGIGALISTMTRAQAALKVTGDEAATFEGKFRNATSALLTGDLIGAFGAFGAQVERISKDLKQAGKDLDEVAAQSKLITLDDAVEQSQKFRDYITEASTVYTRFGEGGTRTKPAVDLEASAAAAAKLSDKLREDALFASRIAPLLKQYPTPLKDASDHAAKLGAGFREGATEATILLGILAQIDRLDLSAKIAQPTFGITRLSPAQAGPRDTTNTEATRRATAEARANRTKELADDLVQAKKELQDEINTQNALKNVSEGRAKRAQDVAVATANVARIEQQIQDQQTAAAKAAASAAEAARREREAAAARLKAEREAAAKQRAAELEEARKAGIAYQIQKADLAIQRAETLTPDNLDDDRFFINREIKLYEALKKKALKLGRVGREAVLTYQSEIYSLKQKLDGLVNDKTANPTDFFAEAAKQFQTYGSNIAGRSGVLSGQDERAAFAADALSNRDQVQQQQLSEQQQQTLILSAINNKLGSQGLVGGAMGDKPWKYPANASRQFSRTKLAQKNVSPN